MAVYQVHFRVDRELTVQVGRLGRFCLARGQYFYTGSARRALEARLRRHLARRKRRHWHIDFLLGRPGVRVDFIVVRDNDRDGGECDLHQRALSRLAAATPVEGFGSSDCRHGCPSHLGRLTRALSFRTILRRLAAGGDLRTIPIPVIAAAHREPGPRDGAACG